MRSEDIRVGNRKNPPVASNALHASRSIAAASSRIFGTLSAALLLPRIAFLVFKLSRIALWLRSASLPFVNLLL